MNWLAIVAIVSLIVGLAAIAVTFVLYRLTLRDPRLVVSIEESVLVDPEGHDQVTVHYEGSRVERVTRSTVTVQNRGRGAYTRSLDAPDDPLIITVPTKTNVMVISVDELAEQRDVASLGLDALIIDDSFGIAPSYLNRSEAVSIDILHDARPGAITAGGSVIGHGEVERSGRQGQQPAFTAALIEGALSNGGRVVGGVTAGGVVSAVALLVSAIAGILSG